MSRRTVLFLHTERPTRRALERERPEGRLVLASDEITAEDAAFWDEVVPLPPAHQVADTLARLQHVQADDVVVQTEHGLLAGVLFAQARGVRAPTPQAALLTTNKWLSRRALAAAGVPVPRHALAQDAAEVRRFADGTWPVVIKPIASTLGHLVTEVSSAADADAAVARLLAELPRSPHIARCAEFAGLAGLDMGCDPLRQFLVEAFAAGPPLETDGLVVGDAIDVFGVTEQVVSAPPRFFIEGYLFPTAHPRLEEATRAAIRAHELTDAGFSIEFRGDTVIEVNGRLGEDDGFPDLFRAALGRTPIAKWLDRDAAPSRARGGHAIAYVNAYGGGVVRAVPDPAGGAEILVAPGSRLFAPPHPDASPHVAYVLASHATDSRAAYAEARRAADRLRFEIDG